MYELNILGIDFEEWFHPELIKPYLQNEKREFKIVNGIDKILNWLRQNETYATFFLVGEILQEYPEIQDKIIDNGHEIAFHTMSHTMLHDMSKDIFNEELKIFNDITKGRSKGFRAPTFSLARDTSWAIDCLIKYNYQYDSSIVPAKTKLYGESSAEISPYRISVNSINSDDSNAKIMEYPIMVTEFLGKKIPAGGGFYLRILPLKIIENTIKSYEIRQIPATFYIHSWELTPEYMPKLKLPIKERFITYHNLEKAMGKMSSLLQKFQFTSFERYIPT